MKKLTGKEEEIMQYIWRLKKAFVNDIIDLYPDPKPHYNTISTVVRQLEEKGYVGHKRYGNTYQYFPLISKEEFRKTFIRDFIKNYFDNSYVNAVSYMAQNEQINPEDLKEIIKMIEKASK